ncbi:hypothetical protein GUITHDRAFT_122136 [Guillardia theta CCMP2712]|uniref:Uncharacterized protein n=1 Tax=Guillardia theta (strain CCMP2712) TaxID=905079 RepID=L1I732_GUITC|nr:hypothetical protein GUITHDRAFT_122136 [Guillardia theta CCMP2712]EKX31675.1 hypothetical protein GUITHDRAFT_122136 [Guillardia theta CCMP2712]|eukprot:XP_005818655.1 hypothetical protein GUITHDRAFT_122136 [Guillardia theta CCMP2712]
MPPPTCLEGPPRSRRRHNPSLPPIQLYHGQEPRAQHSNASVSPILRSASSGQHSNAPVSPILRTASSGQHSNASVSPIIRTPSYTPPSASSGQHSNASVSPIIRTPSYTPPSASSGQHSNASVSPIIRTPSYTPPSASSGQHSNASPSTSIMRTPSSTASLTRTVSFDDRTIKPRKPSESYHRGRAANNEAEETQREREACMAMMRELCECNKSLRRKIDTIERNCQSANQAINDIYHRIDYGTNVDGGNRKHCSTQ